MGGPKRRSCGIWCTNINSMFNFSTSVSTKLNLTCFFGATPLTSAVNISLKPEIANLLRTI